MKIIVISEDDTYFNCAGVAESLKPFGDVTLVLHEISFKKMHIQTDNVIVGYDNIPTDADEYIVTGGRSFLRLLRNDVPKICPTKVILSDTAYVENSEKINNLTADIPTFIMPDLVHHRRGFPYIILYHPFDLSGIYINKDSYITVCHSPAIKQKTVQKGTDIINSIVSELPVKYDLLMRLPWIDTIKRKAKSHIFIDQLDDTRQDFNPALGKSGVEAMLLGCLVMSNFTHVESDIPAPPVILVNKDNLKEKLLYFINNEIARKLMIGRQMDWANLYTSLDFVGHRTMENT